MHEKKNNNNKNAGFASYLCSAIQFEYKNSPSNNYDKIHLNDFHTYRLSEKSDAIEDLCARESRVCGIYLPGVYNYGESSRDYRDGAYLEFFRTSRETFCISRRGTHARVCVFMRTCIRWE